MMKIAKMLYVPTVEHDRFLIEKRLLSPSTTQHKNRYIFVAFAVLSLILCIMIFQLCQKGIAYADDAKDREELINELSDAVKDAIDGLNADELQDFVNSLSPDVKQGLGISDVKELLRTLVNGNSEDFFSEFMKLAGKSLGAYFLGFLPGFLSIIIICLLKNMLGGLTGDFLNGSTTEVVHIVCYCAIIIVLMTGIVGVISSVTVTVDAMTKLSSALFPVLLTLLSMLGGTTAVATYTPMMAVLSSFIMKLVTAVIMPAFVATIVFSVVGNISKSVKLDKLTKLVKSASTWLIGIVFGLFATFLTVQGITGGIVDKFGFNIAKFAISSYVPILGGYLSDGFDLLGASIVLVKNALGYSGVIILLATLLFPLVKVVIFTLTLRLTSAIAEPMGDSRVATLLHNVAGNMNLLITALMGVGFLFFVLLMLIIGTCNIV